MACASLLGLAPTTPEGVQCPTAPVQAVLVRNCCGHLMSRAPLPGERSFVQCRCAEKRSATQRDTVAGPKFEIAPPAPFGFAAPAALPTSRVAFAYSPPASDWRAAPPPRPPSAA